MTAAVSAVDPRLRHVMDMREELKDKKSTFDAQAQKIAELIAPTRSLTLQRLPGELRTRYVRDATGVLASKRLAAFLYGDMLSPATPWVEPYLLARDPTAEEARWFEQCAIRMHARLSGPQSPIATQLYEGAQDATGFGNNVTFRVRRRGEMPRIKSVALAKAYWDENEDDVVDTLYHDYTHTARRAAMIYPHDTAIAKAAEQNPKQELLFCHAVEPRDGGVKGARGGRKPYTSTRFCVSLRHIIDDEQGFDRFPFQVGRFERNSGEVYGTGPGWHAYPAVWSANAMAESILRGGELAVDPIIYGNAALFGGRLDRRPGAFNPIKDNLALYGQRMSDVIGKIDIGGDVGIGVAILERQRELINALFYVDWLWLREGPMMTATEVNARREMRMRMMAPIVARLEQEWLNPLVEDFFFAMLEGRFFDPAPASLAGEEFGFRYFSPLAMAQRGAVVDAINATFDIAVKAHQFDESASLVLKTDEMLREAARNRGVSEKRLRDDRELKALRAQLEAQKLEERNMAAAQAAGSAMQSGAQGLASLRQAIGGEDLAMAA
ncbi:MAG: hypothetical protein BroJett013_30470 [Alphaproteobacteria bacterium]|nr:MAG: hypothetical protein BroJett013_30470 [Alphaproteobacteria bacterium]